MAIHVTPIPTLIEFATPSITIGATAAAGDALTAIRSNSTIAGVALVDSTVDNSIARYAGTAGQLQGYTSNSPTISDAGVISLTSGQLTFPATQAASSDPNTLDDYERGTFTPTLQDDTGSDSEGQGYTTQVGRYVKIGKMVYIQLQLDVSGLGTLTVTDIARIAGLPFTSLNVTNAYATIYCGYAFGLSGLTAGGGLGGYVEKNNTFISCRMWTATTGVTQFKVSNFSTGQVFVSACYEATA